MRTRPDDVDKNLRILVVDDNEPIHDDFRKILGAESSSSNALLDARAALFGSAPEPAPRKSYLLDFAFQGEQALELVRAGLRSGKPYAMAFMDVRMPPGWDGIETVKRIWAEHPELQVVICTAYTDYSWDKIVDELGQSERLLILKKPFDNIEVRQLACALTEKWRLERQARLSLDELERMVEDRTRELTKARDESVDLSQMLQTAKVAADSANQAKSEFLANMSHEIRTPMTAILGHAELMLDNRQSPAEQNASLQAIVRNGQHLLCLINDVLDLSKIEARKMAVERIRCSPVQILADVASMMRVRATTKGLDLKIDYEGAIPETIESDPTRLRQILMNLAGNAIKFTEAGGVRIACACEQTPEPRLRFEIIDTGVGMSPEQLAKLFQPFMQADASTTRKFGGTGLGLSISKQLANALGGNIVVRSQVGAGTTLELTIATGSLAGIRMLEGCREVSEDVTQIPKNDILDYPVESRVQGARVLLAEDGPDNQYLLSTHLKRAGVVVDIVDNGQLAVERALEAAAASAPYDLVLMDMQMPVMDGYTAATTLRKRGYEGPIVALTAHAMSGDRQKCLQAGCDDYCSKPVNRARLLTLVATHIRSAKPVANSPNPMTTPQKPAAMPTVADTGGGDCETPIVSQFRDDPEMQDIISHFVDRLHQVAVEIPLLIADRDFDQVRITAHRLKGAAAGYGFDAIGRAAGRLEECLAQTNDRRGLDRAAAELVAMCRLVRVTSSQPRSQSLTEVAS